MYFDAKFLKSTTHYWLFALHTAGIVVRVIMKRVK